jgi:hypothetical protein
MGECARRFSFRVRGETSTIQIRQSGVCAITSVVWMMFTLIVSLFPYSKQTNPQEMNYIVVVLGGVLVFPLVWYYFPIYGGVHWFEGPVPNVDVYVARKWMTLVESRGGIHSANRQGAGAHALRPALDPSRFL